MRAYFLSLSTGILLGFAWNEILPAISLFVAFVPLFFILQEQNLHYMQVFHYGFISFFVSNFIISNWLFEASFWGGLSVMIINSFAQSLVVVLAHKTGKRSNNAITLISFVLFQLSFEYINFHWEFSMPPIDLGNWLGQIPQAIQWYEYTGILGGSLWILISNVLVYCVIISYMNNRTIRAIFFIIGEIIIILLPLYISKNIYENIKIIGVKSNFAIIQPNINPYTEKYNSSLFEQQIKRQIELANSVDFNDDICIVYPESSFPKYIEDKKMRSDKFIQNLDSLIINNENKSVLASCYSYDVVENDTIFYNTAFMLNSNSELQIYHKSKLVLGVEKIPFDFYFKFLKKLNIDFGGYTTSLSTDDCRQVFSNLKNTVRIAPVICYESVYGEFVTEFVKKGANCLAVITNDAWWGNTAGYKQHLMHSCLRAIENRKAVVRAANTGTSCFINLKGEIIDKAEDWTETVLTGNISTNEYLSFYTKHGDYIGKSALASSLLLIAFIGVKINN